LILTRWIQHLLNSFSSSKRKFRERLANILGYQPAYLSIFEQALNHSSQSSEATKNNERLEFLGDAILDSVIGAYLFNKYPKKEEGFLTELRSKIVSRKKLGELGELLELANYLQYDDVRMQASRRMLGNALEAIIGAVYLDGGYHQAEKFIINKLIKPHINLDTIFETEVNYKSLLLEWAQKRGKRVSFDMAKTDFDQIEERQFVIEAKINDETMGIGKARNKKMAGKQAAKKAIFKLGITVNKN